jgi:hypothetical protein
MNRCRVQPGRFASSSKGNGRSVAGAKCGKHMDSLGATLFTTTRRQFPYRMIPEGFVESSFGN